MSETVCGRWALSGRPTWAVIAVNMGREEGKERGGERKEREKETEEKRDRAGSEGRERREGYKREIVIKRD